MSVKTNSISHHHFQNRQTIGETLQALALIMFLLLSPLICVHKLARISLDPSLLTEQFLVKLSFGALLTLNPMNITVHT